MTTKKIKTPTVWADPILCPSHGKTIREVLYAHRDENNKLAEFAVRCAYWAHNLAILSKKEIAQRCAERASQCAYEVSFAPRPELAARYAEHAAYETIDAALAADDKSGWSTVHHFLQEIFEKAPKGDEK